MAGRQQDARIEIVEGRVARDRHRQHLALRPGLAAERRRAESRENDCRSQHVPLDCRTVISVLPFLWIRQSSGWPASTIRSLFLPPGLGNAADFLREDERQKNSSASQS